MKQTVSFSRAYSHLRRKSQGILKKKKWNEFSKFAGYKIDAQTLIRFLWIRNKWLGTEIRNTLPFAITLKKWDTGLYSPKCMEYLYTENNTMLMREIK